MSLNLQFASVPICRRCTANPTLQTVSGNLFGKSGIRPKKLQLPIREHYFLPEDLPTSAGGSLKPGYLLDIRTPTHPTIQINAKQ
jgi:hypothetical protein